jgi:dTDP-4-amino-4,6-dideoxy-D-galactose acyltransferase
MKLFEILGVDTKIFGFPVAKILPARLAAKELEQVLSLLKSENVRLAFWASDPNDEESQRAARLYHGFLADKKVTFAMDLGQSPERPEAMGWDIEEYADELPCADLENLAIEIGRNSRFGADPRIPEDRMIDMYRLWIRNSVNKQVADAVLVVRQSGNIVGMSTVVEKNGCGCIGLFAVDAALRGRNVGVSLARAAQEWARRKGLRFAQVVTQETNVAACRLYEKCGYRIDKVEYFYHFWI